MGLQDCFEVSAHLIVNRGKHEDDERLVHGLPIGRGPGNDGKRFWHAWVELTKTVALPMTDPETGALLGSIFTRSITFTMVIDKSNGQDVCLPVDTYYRIGQLTEDHVWRYTGSEARHHMLETGNYGPWVADWETMGL